MSDCLRLRHSSGCLTDAILTLYYSGKKYAKLKRRKEAEKGIEKYEPFLVNSVNYPCVFER